MPEPGHSGRAHRPMEGPEGPPPVVADRARPAGSRWWYLLLALPFVGLLWVPFYASVEPRLLGFPFFYWYQFAWVPLAAVLTWIVLAKTR